ncbi:MAG TPA: RDD family protein [Alphaproteobacteria bacterium]|nr:RDD family protein [Alphaproteobacteria bacterium]
MGAGVAYASFGRRAAALAVDSVLIAAILVAIIVAANAFAGPVFAAFWTTPFPVHSYVEVASRTSERQDDGGTREVVVSRQTRVFADGTVRIYLVAEGKITARDGAVSTTHVEDLIGRNGRDLLRAWLTGGLGFLLSFVYFAAFEASTLQATPGKAALGLKVADLSGAPIGLGRSLFRQAMKVLEFASSGITYIIAAFTARHQALHDIFAGTVVLRTASRPLATARRATAF